MSVQGKKYAAIVLAAGLSTRLKKWKPAILINNIPLIFHTLKPLINECSRIVIVGGHNFEKLKELIAEYSGMLSEGMEKVVLIQNREFEKGMFSSVKLGVEEISSGYDSIFIIPGDMPLVQEKTYSLIKGAFEETCTDVVIPSVKVGSEQTGFSIVKGHPILINMKTAERILSEKGDSTLRDVLKSSVQKIILVEDKGICIDVDNENDLETVLLYLSKNEKQE